MCGAHDMQVAPHEEGALQGATLMVCPNCDRGERCQDPNCDSAYCADATSTTTTRCKVYDGVGPSHDRDGS